MFVAGHGGGLFVLCVLFVRCLMFLCFQPECDVALAQCAAHLALAPKSVDVYAALQRAKEHVQAAPNLPPPVWIRNAPTRLMKELGYGRDYVYTPEAADEHDALRQTYLPVKSLVCALVHLSRFWFSFERTK
jgi:replication-associated recombination protein RarA